jgi:hypothetical protein
MAVLPSRCTVPPSNPLDPVRFLIKLTVTLVVILGLLAGFDIATKTFVEGQIEQEVQSAPDLEVADVEASISSFPFLGKLAASGEVDSFTIDLIDIATPQLAIAELSITGDGIQFDRNGLFQGDVRVEGVDEATASLTLTDIAVSEAIGVQVGFAPGSVTVTSNGVTVQAQASVVDGVLTFSTDGVGTFTLDVSVPEYLPCAPNAVAEQGSVTLSCTASELPPVVFEALGNPQLGS